MPFYEYECGGCGHRLEVLQPIGEAPLHECPSCHKASLRRLVSAAGFRLKGSGWYVTDFRDKSAKEKVKADGEGAVKPEAKPAVTNSAGKNGTSDSKSKEPAVSPVTSSGSE